MANNNLKLQLTFTAKGGSQVVGDLKALEARLADIKRRNEELAKATEGLQNLYGISAEEARALAEQLEQISLTKADEEAQKFNTTLAGISATAAGLAVALGAVFQQGLQTSIQFEQFAARLETTLGGTAAADRAFSRIEKFTATTPFQLDEVTDAFINLKNRGVDPTDEVLRQLGDLAASQSKSLGQLVEAVLDAQQGEFERLKEFGVRASVSGDKATISFKGLNQTVERTPEAIAGAIFALGDLQGVAGGMEKQSQTLAGQFSNLEDAATTAKREFGDLAANGLKPFVASAIALLNTFNNLPAPVQKMVVGTTALATALFAAVAAVTAFQLAGGKLIVTTALQNVQSARNTAIIAANTALKRTAAAVEVAFALATGQATAAQAAQATALAATAAKLGLFAAAGTAVAAVVTTFIDIREAGAAGREGVEQINAALSELDEANARVAESGAKAAESIAAAAERNRQSLENSLNPLNRFLDNFRQPLSDLQDALNAATGGTSDFSTAAEAAGEEASIAFDNVALAASEVYPQAAQVVSTLEEGGTVAQESIDKTKDAIDAAIASLEAQRPVEEADIQRKNEQIEKLKDYKARIEAAVKAQDEQKDSLGRLNKALAENAQAYQNNLAGLERGRLEAELRRLQSGADAREQALKDEEQYLNDRIALNTARLSELQAVLTNKDASPELVAETQKEIAQIEEQILRDRIGLAKQAVEEQQRIEADARRQREEDAQAEADALREAREEEQRVQEEGFSETQRQQEEAFRQQQQANEQAFRDEQQSAEEAFQEGQRQEEETFRSGIQAQEEAFNESQQSAEEAFQEQLQTNEQAFNDAQRDSERAFQRQQQAEEKAFQQAQQDAERAFQAEQDAAKEDADREFEERRREIERKLQLDQAATPEERRQLRDQFKQEDEDLERREKAFAPLEEDIKAFQEQQQAEQEAFRQQQLAEQEALRAQQQAEQDAFQEQQRQEQIAFDAAQREAEKLFQAELTELEKAFNTEIQAQEQEFQAQQREEEKLFREEQQSAERSFQEQQRAIERAFQDQQRAAEAAFKDQQRQLDRANAQEIARILAAARTNVGARKEGGPVLPGQPYLVGEEGPELIVPRRGGYVLTAKQTAAMMQRPGVPALPSHLGASDGAVLRQLQRLTDIVSKRDRPSAPATYNIVGEADPYGKAIELSMAHQRAMIRSRGL